MQWVDLPLGEEFHSTAASYYLTAEANDGYEVVFAWAELDLTFSNKSVYVVTKGDGKPLPAKASISVVGLKRAAVLLAGDGARPALQLIEEVE